MPVYPVRQWIKTHEIRVLMPRVKLGWVVECVSLSFAVSNTRCRRSHRVIADKEDINVVQLVQDIPFLTRR